VAVLALHVAVGAVHCDGPELAVLGHLIGGGVADGGGQLAVVIDVDRVLVGQESPRAPGGRIPEAESNGSGISFACL
jgi:hypothetical protein